jgi:glycosyltransferase involved in cell wall biosynthesis
MFEVSLILCTHNPRLDFLGRTLRSLQTQTLARARWELVVVDNASTESLNGRIDLSWHPNARLVREEELGLTAARLRGLRESRAELLVFADDDNVLAPDYLEQALGIALEHPQLGAWGGVIEGDFEVPPPAWATPYLAMLALRTAARDRWSNSFDDWSAVPFGAGLCVRRRVAVAWSERVNTDTLRRRLGRRGASLTAAEDTDLALTACDCGLGTGVFVRLRLTHLIPQARVTPEYFERLAEAMGRSHVLLASFRDSDCRKARIRLLDMLRRWRRWWRMSPEQRRVEMALERGRAAAYAELNR